MRIAFIGVSHFHAHSFIDSVISLKVHKIVAVSDPILQFAEKCANSLGVTAYADYREMCETAKPELVIALGRPDKLAATAEYLIRSGVPSIIEKPAGVNVAEIARLRDIAQEQGTFATIPFSLRFGLLARSIKARCGEDELTYASFRILSGKPDRYINGGVAWNLDPLGCGGGSTLNIGSQYFDLIRYLSPSAKWKVKGATMSSQLTGIAVEEYSSVLLESGGKSATVETGYLIPGAMEVSVSVCVGPRVFRMVAPKRLLIREPDGSEEEMTTPMTQSSWYPLFIEDVISRISTGRSPAVTLDDMLEAAVLTESAYRMTRFDECMSAPAV